MTDTIETFPLLGRDPVDEAYIEDVAQTKRFLEHWSAFPDFRERLPHDTYGVTAEAGLKADPEVIRPSWDSAFKGTEISPSVLRYRAFLREKLQMRPQYRASTSHNEAFNAWRQRQINRTFGELGIAKADGIVHAGAAFELCRGCSVGCWFCGIGAKKLVEVWPYTDENAALWRGTLQALYDLIGQPAKQGFCYWATDPLDNPDYEKFLCDFHDIMGRFPQTTTAQPMRDPERIRALLALSRSRGGQVERFSVLTKGTLRKVFETYTPSELVRVELVLQMEGNTTSKAFAGKARDNTNRFEKEVAPPASLPGTGSTIACVSGFLVRMPENLIELISPCPANERWPLGYRVHDRRTFASIEELRSHISDMTSETAMPRTVGASATVRWRRDLRFSATDDGFVVENAALRHAFNNSKYPAMRELGALLVEPMQAGDIALRLADTTSTPLEETFHVLNRFYAGGLFDDEPALTQRLEDDDAQAEPASNRMEGAAHA